MSGVPLEASSLGAALAILMDLCRMAAAEPQRKIRASMWRGALALGRSSADSHASARPDISQGWAPLLVRGDSSRPSFACSPRYKIAVALPTVRGPELR